MHSFIFIWLRFVPQATVGSKTTLLSQSPCSEAPASEHTAPEAPASNATVEAGASGTARFRAGPRNEIDGLNFPHLDTPQNAAYTHVAICHTGFRSDSNANEQQRRSN